jgi:undecaprenyl diphosphate synthase
MQSQEALERGLAAALDAAVGNVDLLIRTGGEKRLSDFLLWESAYAELVFTDRMWPDFDETNLEAAVAEFRRRERRFGGVPTANTETATVAADSERVAAELSAEVLRTP